ncbi:MAG: cysteine synthase family protein [Planctomycetes bacterium]|nr:cysteine synthase family protein [Planctomycetota bacterium]
MTSTLNNPTLAESVGNTPLLPLRKLAADTSSQVFAKAEWLNPSGSVKVRAAARIVAEGFADGRLKGRTLIDSTSGNTGIAYAFLGAALGFPVELVVPENVSPERKAMIRGYGAKMTYSSPFDGSDGAIVLCRELVAKSPERYFYADQYGNDANWRAHFDGTGPEIWRQTQGRITHFVAGLGTSGTFMGTGRFLRKVNPSVKLISVEPASPIHGLEGMKHMASAIVPPIYDASLADRAMEIETEDAYRMVLRLAREEAILAGFSSGAAIAAALQVARENPGACVVTVLPDGGDRYLSTPVWEEILAGH